MLSSQGDRRRRQQPPRRPRERPAQGGQRPRGGAAAPRRHLGGGSGRGEKAGVGRGRRRKKHSETTNEVKGIAQHLTHAEQRPGSLTTAGTLEAEEPPLLCVTQLLSVSRARQERPLS